MHVLIADDDSLVLSLVAFALEQGGFRVASAADGLEALDSARASRPDLIILDAEMPRLDGFATLAALQADSSLKHIPVLMLTARRRPEDVVRARDLGASAYVAKPFDAASLLARVERCLNARPRPAIVAEAADGAFWLE